MLQVQDGAVYEIGKLTATNNTATNCVTVGQYTYWPGYTPNIYWGNYPVYVTTDKTAKAIEILKALQADKLIKCKDVDEFIALVEKIYGIL